MGVQGINFVVDLEACLYYAGAGGNLKSNIIQKAKEARVAVTREVFAQLRMLERDLAEELLAEGLEVVELDTPAYTAAGALTELLIATGVALNAAANDKIPVIALTHCAQNGQKPPCYLVSGDTGTHSSSMRSLCAALGIPNLKVSEAF